MNFYSPVSNTRCHSIGHKMRIARIKIRVDSQGRWGKSLGRERNFEEVCFESSWNGILVEKTSFEYQEGVNSRVVDRWQRKPFCQVMIWHMEWKEQVNQKIA